MNGWMDEFHVYTSVQIKDYSNQTFRENRLSKWSSTCKTRCVCICVHAFEEKISKLSFSLTRSTAVAYS